MKKMSEIVVDLDEYIKFITGDKDNEIFSGMMADRGQPCVLIGFLDFHEEFAIDVYEESTNKKLIRKRMLESLGSMKKRINEFAKTIGVNNEPKDN